MSVLTHPAATHPAPAPTAPAYACSPKLLDGTELVGKAEGSGLREPPYLVRRRDGQVVQLSQLLYVIASHMDGRSLAAVAESAGASLDLRITPEQIAHVAERKLAPLGLVPYADGREPHLAPVDALFALKFRVGVVSERGVNTVARLLQPLFATPIVLAALAALLVLDLWLVTGHGIGAGLSTVIQSPVLGLALFAVVPISMAFHECGHAAACRYGGARPGRIGIGIYLVWPVFFTDVTDSYRLSKAGRLRVDLGGVYFNVLVALATATAYFATGYEPLLLVVISQQMLILDQFIPWVRLDGYHIFSDLIGVSDLFERIKPVLASLRPGARPDRRVTELKTWARVAVTAWVATTVMVLTAMAVITVVHAPGYLRHAWQSLLTQFDTVGHGVQVASVVEVLVGTIGTFMLVLPVAGITLTYLLLCSRLGTVAALRRVRTDLTLVAAGGEKGPHPHRTEIPAAPAAQRG